MTESSQRISALVRAALFVDDLPRSKRFYQAIGLTAIYYEDCLSGESTPAVLALPAGTETRCCILKPEGGQNKGMVGLFALTEPQPPKLARSAVGPSRGEVALVFYVDDVGVTLNAAEAAGGQRLADPINYEMPHRSQPEVCLRDPDGILINLVQRPPEETEDTRSALEIAGAI
ncbi:MAG: VOC family protein [Woeseiaceae bacterium]